MAVPSNVGPATMQELCGSRVAGHLHRLGNGDRGIRWAACGDFLYRSWRRSSTRLICAVFRQCSRSPKTPNDTKDPFGINRFSGTNVNSIAIEIPIARITKDRQAHRSAEQSFDRHVCLDKPAKNQSTGHNGRKDEDKWSRDYFQVAGSRILWSTN